MLWLFPYAFRPEEIGLIRLMLSVAAMFATLSSFGGSQIAIRFFPYFADPFPRRAAFINLLFGLVLFGCILFSLVFLSFNDNVRSIYSNKSSLFILYLWYLLPLTISLILYGLIESFIIVQGQPIVPTILREIYTRAILTVASIAFLVAAISFTAFIQLVSLLYCFAPLMIFLYGYQKGFLQFAGGKNEIRKHEWGELFQFGTFAFLGNASAVLLANIDSVVLSAYSGLVSTGIYSIALFIAVIIEIPKRSLSQVLIPMVVKANKEQDMTLLDSLYKKSSINQFIVGAVIFLIIWLNIDGIFALIPNGQVYRDGKWVVFLIGLAKLFDMLTGINAEIIGTSRYYKIDLLIYGVLSLVGIGLNFLLIPRYGVVGAALAAFSSIVLYNAMRFVFIAIVMKIQPFSKKTAIAALCIVVTFGIVSLVPNSNILSMNLILRTVLIGLIFGGLILRFHVSDDISLLFKKIVTRFYSQA
jgi:O-antigen/teichoic acid export membrane protein